MDVCSLWDFSDPEGSRARFVEAAHNSEDADERFILKTQIARTHSWKKEIADAHAVLDKIEGELEFRSDEAKSFYLLERGRTFNSDGNPRAAEPLFEKAASLRVPGLWADALHMVAIVQKSKPESEARNREALALVQNSEHEEDQKWRATLLNNLGWDLHEQEKYIEALDVFQQAQAERERLGDASRTNIARWCVARCLRSLGRFEEALAIQRELKVLEPEDQYVDEEISELEKALGAD